MRLEPSVPKCMNHLGKQVSHDTVRELTVSRPEFAVKEEPDDDVVLIESPTKLSRSKWPATRKPPRSPSPVPEYDAAAHEEEVVRAYLELQLRLTKDDRIALAFLMEKLYSAGSKVPQRGFFAKLDKEVRMVTFA